jgi:hypothetical protein
MSLFEGYLNILKNYEAMLKGAGRVAQVLKRLPSKCEAKKKKKNHHT